MNPGFQDVLLDTSVVVKWFVPEPDSIKALALRQAHAEGQLQLFVPDWLLMELSNALRKSGKISTKAIPKSLRSLYDYGIGVIPFDSETLAASLSLCDEYGLTSYDSYFVALAGTLGIPLVTADGKMISRLSSDENSVIDLKEI